jgi:hypothetical protein
MNTRRNFLMGLALAGATVTAWNGRLNGQSQNPPILPLPPTQDHRPQEATPDTPPMPGAEKKMLEENDKDMKKKVDRLYELATQLKNEVDKTDSSKVLSLNLVKKAEEIEKLARDIKNRSKG